MCLGLGSAGIGDLQQRETPGYEELQGEGFLGLGSPGRVPLGKGTTGWRRTQELSLLRLGQCLDG